MARDEKVLPVCPEYVDIATCLSCPYPDGQQPCLRKIQLRVEISPQDLSALQEIEKASGLTRKAVIHLMIAFYREHLNPVLKE